MPKKSSYPYPYNLIEVILDTDPYEATDHQAPEVLKERIQTSMENLTENQQEVLRMRYQEGMSYPAIAKAIGTELSGAPRYEQQALRALRHPTALKHILHGEVPQPAVQKELSLEETPLRDLGVSTKISSQLERAGIKTVGDVLSADAKTILKTPFIGKKLYDELLQSIEARGGDCSHLHVTKAEYNKIKEYDKER